MVATTTYTSQHIVDLITHTDLLLPDEKQKLISFLPNIRETERNILGSQIEEYEARKQEILQDAEKRKRQIEQEYYEELRALHHQQQQEIRAEIKKREAQEKSQSNNEADALLQSA